MEEGNKDQFLSEFDRLRTNETEEEQETNRIALVIGRELDGVSDELLAYKDVSFCLRMVGFVERFVLCVVFCLSNSFPFS